MPQMRVARYSFKFNEFQEITVLTSWGPSFRSRDPEDGHFLHCILCLLLAMLPWGQALHVQESQLFKEQDLSLGAIQREASWLHIPHCCEHSCCNILCLLSDFSLWPMVNSLSLSFSLTSLISVILERHFSMTTNAWWHLTGFKTLLYSLQLLTSLTISLSASTLCKIIWKFNLPFWSSQDKSTMQIQTYLHHILGIVGSLGSIYVGKQMPQLCVLLIHSDSVFN